MEYSITAEELQEILDLVANGWNCERFEKSSRAFS